MLIMIKFPHIYIFYTISTDPFYISILSPARQKNKCSFYLATYFTTYITSLLQLSAIHPTTYRGWGISCGFPLKIDFNINRHLTLL